MSIPRPKKGIFKLPTGQRLRSNDPVKEFERNVQARWRMLSDEDLDEECELANVWGEDALNRRRGVVSVEDRARMLNLSTVELLKLDARFKELDQTIWKKAADFYRGLLASGIFDQTVRLSWGIYNNHKVWGWDEISKISGASRATLFRRIKFGADFAELFASPRAKAETVLIDYYGQIYTIAEFAADNGLSQAHVRTCYARGLDADQILSAPRRSRGRPKAPGVQTLPSQNVDSILSASEIAAIDEILADLKLIA